MFDLEKWREIYDVFKANKLRTFLTSFSVSWGIFMLIILLGAGKGLRNGFEYDFRDDAINSVWLRPGQLSMPFRGMQSGRRIKFTNEDFDMIGRAYEEVDHITGRYAMWSVPVEYNNEVNTLNFRGVHPDHKFLENTEVTRGRYISNVDLQEVRKVAVIGIETKQALFGEKEALGEYITIFKIPFKVVGIFEDSGGRWENSMIYLPVTTAQKVFNAKNELNRIMFTTGDASNERVSTLVEDLRLQLSDRLLFDPSDERALHIHNNVQEFALFNSIFTGINAFVWIIGIMTLIAGVVGISNIMMITVKERTKEIGIRKALGATPNSITTMILMEAVVVTSIAGYTGLVLGVFGLEYLSSFTKDPGTFMNPGVDFGVAFSAAVLLVIFGTIAGLIPAMKASRVKPIVALRDE
ncbi:MAG TPA: ABC transporter permease [Flavobacteriales bacterium]|jgi:putative ABC transport system permease protein|nr:ABC transporter permease [Flavobacteriales bacterium]